MAVNQQGFYNPPRGTHHGDGFRQGLTYDASYDNGLPGAPLQPVYVQDFIPLTAQINNLVTTITPVSSGDLTITAGTGTTAGTFGANGIYATIFDVPRALACYGTTGNAAATITVWGFDKWNVPMTEQIASSVTTGVPNYGKKAFAGVTRINISAGTTGAITIGTSDIFGLDYRIASKNYVIPFWNEGVDPVFDAGFFGTATLGSGVNAAGTCVISSPQILANSQVIVTRTTSAGTAGYFAVPVASIVPGVSFTVQSLTATATVQTLDTSTFNWWIVPASSTVTSGTATLIAGAATVTNTNVAATSLIFTTYNTGAVACGNLRAPAASIVAGTNFVINSSAGTDISTVNWVIVTPGNATGTTAAMVLGTIATNNSNIVASGSLASTIIASRNTLGTAAGIFNISAQSNGAFTLLSAAGTETSTFNYIVLSPVLGNTSVLDRSTVGLSGILQVGDGSTATATTGDTRGTYKPSTPSNGVSRLTIWTYNRGCSAVANYYGNLNNDTTLTNTVPNLFGVPQYYVTPF